MTTIRAACHTCGPVELDSSDIRLMVCDRAPLSYYEFGCPTCHDDVRKPADDQVISLLLSGGVKAIAWTVDPRPAGPLLTEDDLIAFGQQLHDAPTDEIALRASPVTPGGAGA